MPSIFDKFQMFGILPTERKYIGGSKYQGGRQQIPGQNSKLETG